MQVEVPTKHGVSGEHEREEGGLLTSGEHDREKGGLLTSSET